MHTPAAKRKRADAANAVLRKPFQSPVIRRPNGVDQDETSSSKTPDVVRASAIAANSPSSPSTQDTPLRVQAQVPAQARSVKPARSLGALRPFQTPRSGSSRPQPSFKSPTQLQSGVKKRKKSFPIQVTPTSKAATQNHDDEAESRGPAASILALVAAHRHTTQDVVIRDLDAQLETVRQARLIEGASSGEEPKVPVDQELRELVGKWKGASRMAAEELFEIVKERVDNAGGPKAWKEMRQRQMEFYQSFDFEPQRSRGDADECLQEEVEGTEEENGERVLDAEDHEEGEESDTQFNMAQMLQSLNIDLSLLGYDREEEKWTD